VPVRFSAEAIEQVKRLAEAEGMTTSTWIRRAVEEKVRRELQNDERPRAQG
jgi:predicted DNA binding CopG/RHH family protein